MAFQPFWQVGLTADIAEKAEIELGETAERKKEALEEMLGLIEGKEGFCPLTDEEFLIRFLRHGKYDVKKAFKTFENYYSFKAEYSGRLTDIPIEKFRKILETQQIFFPPRRNKSGDGVFTVFLGSPALLSFSPDDMVGFMFAFMEICLQTDASQVCGGGVVLDCKGMTWKTVLSYLRIDFIRVLIRMVQSCYPIRITGIHLVNEPIYARRIYNLIKPWMLKKVRDRLYFHGCDWENLHKHIYPELLPVEFGGTLSQEDSEKSYNILFQNEALLRRINSYIYQNHKYPKQDYTHQNETTDTNKTLRSLFVIPKS